MFSYMITEHLRIYVQGLLFWGMELRGSTVGMVFILLGLVVYWVSIYRRKKDVHLFMYTIWRYVLSIYLYLNKYIPYTYMWCCNKWTTAKLNWYFLFSMICGLIHDECCGFAFVCGCWCGAARVGQRMGGRLELSTSEVLQARDGEVAVPQIAGGSTEVARHGLQRHRVSAIILVFHETSGRFYQKEF